MRPLNSVAPSRDERTSRDCQATSTSKLPDRLQIHLPSFAVFAAKSSCALPESGPTMGVRGFADVHNHQFAHLGFGGLAFHGAPSGPLEDALPWCDFLHVPPFGLPGRVIHGPAGMRDLVGQVFAYAYRRADAVLPGIGHKVGGYPQFDGWPRWNSVTHQSVHEDWLKRAVDGGLRLMVMHAVNNESMAALVDKIYPPDDMLAAERQLAAAHAFEAHIDDISGGPGTGWYRIVGSPQEALAVMDQGNLAVVLGIEVDFLFGCRSELDLTPQQLRDQLDKYYEMGVRHLFPIHFADNGFGGTAYQNLTEIAQGEPTELPFFNKVDLEDGTAFGYEDRGGHRNVRGLTNLGKLLIREMIARKMIIDVDHMSGRSRSDAMDICGEFNYPVISGHSGFIEISHGHKCHEGQLTSDEVDRIIRLGGMLSVIPCQGNLDEIDTWAGPNQTRVNHISGNTSNTTLQAYQYAASKSGGRPVALGTDFNGFAGLPGPRFGPERAPGKEIPGVQQNQLDYKNLVSITTGTPLPMSVVGDKIFDLNYDGLAHVGMLPDFIADWQAQGLKAADLDPLLQSAQGYVDLWSRASSARRTRDAQFVSHTMKPSLELGEKLQVNVTMRNSGSVKWLPGEDYRLGSQNPQDNETWGTARVELPGPVPPDQNAVFTFPIHAPNATGMADFQWRMLVENVEWFGDRSPNKEVLIHRSDVPSVVPDVEELSRESAEEKIHAAGLAVTFTGTRLPLSRVEEQQPAAGSVVDQGSMVTVRMARHAGPGL